MAFANSLKFLKGLQLVNKRVQKKGKKKKKKKKKRKESSELYSIFGSPGLQSDDDLHYTTWYTYRRSVKNN